MWEPYSVAQSAAEAPEPPRLSLKRMNNLFVFRMPGITAVIAFVAIFSLGFLGTGLFERYLARQNLSRQALIMLRGFQDAVDETRADLTRLPPLDHLQCSYGLSPALSLLALHNPYVRWFAVMRGGQVICSSSPIDLDIASNHHLHRIDNVWSVLFVPAKDQSGFLFMVQNRGDVEYLALLAPLLFDFESSVICPHCISYELVLHARPEIAPRFGDTWNQAVIFSKVNGRVGRVGVTLTLSATQDYIDQFRFHGRLLAAAFTTILALAVSFALYSYLNAHRSLAYLVQQGIRRHEFLPYYQPIVDSRHNSVIGAEAMIRWRTKSGELISPGQFIAFAEDSGLIHSITGQIIEQVLSDLKLFGWHRSERYISINVMPEQLIQSSFCDDLLRRLAEEGIPAKNLAIEITERHQIRNLDQGKRILSRLQDAGIDIKLDDAGTGFGGFSYVQELPIGTLKIDKMFVDTLLTEGDAKRHVLDAMIEFAKISELKVIAEGVETPEQVKYLAHAGVYAIQGYVYAYPMPAPEFTAWLAVRNPESREAKKQT